MRKRKGLVDKVQTSYRDARKLHMSKGNPESVWWYLGFLVRKGYAEQLLAMEDLTEEERNRIVEMKKES